MSKQVFSPHFGNMTRPPRIGNFTCHFIQNWRKLTPYNIISLNQIKQNVRFTNKHISQFGMVKYNFCGTVQLRCHKMVIFSVPWIGNFLLEFGEKPHTFCHWEHDPISVIKMSKTTVILVIPQSHTADQLMAPWGRATEHQHSQD